MRVEKEGKPRCKVVHIEAPLYGRHYVSNPIGQGEGEFLNGRGPCLTDMISTDADRIPTGDLFGAIFNGIDNDTNRGLRRKHEGLLGNEFLQHIVLDRSSDLPFADSLLLCEHNIHRE